jgi:glutaredoxin 3
MSDELVLYVKKSCPWCIAAEDYLKKNGYQWREIDVLASQSSFSEMQKLSGQRYVPTLVVGEKILADFDTTQLEAFLKKEGIEPA